MKVAKPLISLAVVYLLLGPILFLLERNLLGWRRSNNCCQLRCWGAFFFAFSFFELAFGDRLRRTQNKTNDRLLLATKIVRLFICPSVVFDLCRIGQDAVVYTLRLTLPDFTW